LHLPFYRIIAARAKTKTTTPPLAKPPVAAKIQKGAAYGCPCNFSPLCNLGFAAQNARKNRRNAPEISGKSNFGGILQLR